jgi:DNA glycosylase AlkZ-like
VPIEAPWSFPVSADFATAESWLGREISTVEEPAHQLVRRYLAAFGPATVTDAQSWSALSGLKPVFEDLRPELVTFRDDKKRELFDLPEAPRPAADVPAPVRFVADFDNLVLAHVDRRRVIADEHRPKVVTKNLLVRATFLVDGFVAGLWKVERKKKVASLVLEPFQPLDKKTLKALEAEGDRLLAFQEEDAPVREVRTAS